MRTKAERRKNDYKKAIRKKNIAEQCYGNQFYDNLHQYSKNKVHCSCPMCSFKTDMNTKDNMTHSDKIKIESMNSQMDDVDEE